MPLTDHAPPPDAVAVRVSDPPPLLLTLSVTVLPAGAVPPAETLPAFAAVTGLVNELMDGVATAAVSLVAVTVDVGPVVPIAFFAVAA
jgi:hypothetical protein